jgi:hypothetical protein
MKYAGYLYGLHALLGLFLTDIAAHDAALQSVGPKTLASLALQIVLQNNPLVVKPNEEFIIDCQLQVLLSVDESLIDSIPSDFNCLIPKTSESVAQDLLNNLRIGYHDRDTVVEDSFGRYMQEGYGFVAGRTKYFEILHTKPQIARAIERKKKDPTS